MKIVEALDIPSTEREAVKAFVYYVENGEAKKLAEILKKPVCRKKGHSKTTDTGSAETLLLLRQPLQYHIQQFHLQMHCQAKLKVK